MKKNICLVVSMCLAMMFAGCGSTSPDPDPVSGVTVTLAPINGATDQAVDATVTAIFSAAITAPADWTTAFTLIAAGATETLCTAVAYDADTLTATCTHANLTVSTEHTITVSGLTDSAGLAITTATAIFTTTSDSSNNATFTSKNSVTTVAGDEIVSLVFTFDSAPSSTPTIAVAEASASLSASESVDDDLSLALAAGTCTVSESDALVYTCTVDGVAGCTTLTDYTATISVADVEAGTLTFNSADDEFTSADTLGAKAESGTCWTQNNVTARGTVSVNESTGTFDVAYIDCTQDLAKELIAGKAISLADVGDVAVMFYISANAPVLGVDELQITRNKIIVGAGVDDDVWLDTPFGASAGTGIWLAWSNVTGVEDANNIANPTAAGSFADYTTTYSGVYVCSVKKDNVFKTYISFDGSTYIEMTESNMEVYAGQGTLANAVNPSPTATLYGLEIGSKNDDDGTCSNDYTTSFGYVRLKSTGITGLSATDCPQL